MVKAYSANQVTSRKIWITALVSHSAPTGALFLFSRARKAGIVRLPAAEYRTSAASSDHDR